MATLTDRAWLATTMISAKKTMRHYNTHPGAWERGTHMKLR